MKLLHNPQRFIRHFNRVVAIDRIRQIGGVEDPEHSITQTHSIRVQLQSEFVMMMMMMGCLVGVAFVS